MIGIDRETAGVILCILLICTHVMVGYVAFAVGPGSWSVVMLPLREGTAMTEAEWLASDDPRHVGLL